MRKELLYAIVAGTGGLVIGGGIGYVIANHLANEKIEDAIDKEVAEVKKYYRDRDEPSDGVEEDGGFSDETDENGVPYGRFEVSPEDEKLLEEFVAIQNRESYTTPEEAIDYNDPKNYSSIRSKLDNSRPYTLEESEEIDERSEEYRELLENRDSSEPYLITIDEFMTDSIADMENQTLTYFEADDTLMDDRERVIHEVEATVGSDNLTKFGQFSKDKDLVYVRNERIDTQFEIVRDTRSYVEAIAGFKEPRKVHRMREDD